MIFLAGFKINSGIFRQKSLILGISESRSEVGELGPGVRELEPEVSRPLVQMNDSFLQFGYFTVIKQLFLRI